MMKRIALMVLLLFILSAIGGAVWLFTQKNSPLFKPIQQYQLVSELNFLQPEEVDHIMNRYFGVSFWDVELDVIQAKLTELDWVSQARVKRHWPDLLSVSIEEQKPVARWGDLGLINQAGDVFYPKERHGFDNLVLLDGNVLDSEMILRSHVAFQIKLQVIEFTISALKHQLDGVWNIELLKGSKIVLDAQEEGRKLDRFVATYPKLSNDLRKSPQVYDLRYSNGFIVGKNSNDSMGFEAL